MTDFTPEGMATRVKRAYNKRAPTRTAEVRGAEVRNEEVAPKKVRVRKGVGRSPTDIPREMIPEGVDLQWVTSEIHGQPWMHGRTQYEVNAWEPVLPQMFDGRFDGMFMPKGHKGEIQVFGAVLMWRPMELTMQARAEEYSAAQQPLEAMKYRIRSGEIEGVSLETQHPSARAVTRLSREVITPMPIPNK